MGGRLVRRSSQFLGARPLPECLTRERGLETALEHVEEYFPNVAEGIKRMNSEYEQTRIGNPQLEPTEHDPKFEFNPQLTEEEKQEIRK